MATDDLSSKSTTELPRGQLGVWGIVFFVVAAAAPLVGMTGAFPIAAALGTGSAAPGAYLVVGLTLLLFSMGYAAMSQEVVNAGAFFAYIGRGIGPSWGIGSAYVSILTYLAIQLSLYGFFGSVVSTYLVGLPWWVAAFASWGAVTILSLYQVDVGAKLLGFLMILEVLSLVVTAGAILISGGPEGIHFWTSFNPSAILAGGLSGSAGIAFAFAFASYIGFEATAIYGEESTDPKTAVPKATYLAVVVITALFALTSFSIITGLGATKAVDEIMRISTVNAVPLSDPSAVLFSLASTYVSPLLAQAMKMLVMSSLFAGLLAFQNSTSRYIFALSRIGALPARFCAVSKRGSPAMASMFTSGIAGVVVAIFAIAKLDPVLNLFYWFSGLAVVAIVLIEVLVCVAVVLYFNPGMELVNPFKTVIAPVLSGMLLTVGEFLLISRFGLLAGTVADGVDPSVTPWGLSALGWTLVGFPFLLLGLGIAVSHYMLENNRPLLSDGLLQ
jgi:amino acid transporter